MKPLWAHQTSAINKAMPLSHFALFNDPGTGKTRTVIEILRLKSNERKALFRTLIVAPPITLGNWKSEWLKYTNITGDRVSVLSGTAKKRLEIFLKPENRQHIFIMNYECLLMKELFHAIQMWEPEAIVFDEMHRTANPSSKRSKLADTLANPGTKLSPKVRPLVYGLTGTPITNNLMDIFQQFKILDGGDTFGQNFYEFRARYFRDRNSGMPKQRYFPDWVALPGAGERISKSIEHCAVSVKKETCLDLPPLIETTICVDMTPEQKRIYKEMREEFVAHFTRGKEEHAVVASLAMVKGLRLMQISSGFVKTDEGLEIAANEGWTPKQDALYDLLESLTPSRKVIVWAVFKYNYKQIREVCEKLKIKYLELNGEVGPAKNRENAALFESDDSYRVVIAHPESAGEGLNLVSASEMISYSRDFSYRRWVQCAARNYRGGSEIHDKITRYILVSNGTVEERITLALCNKQEISEKVLKEIIISE